MLIQKYKICIFLKLNVRLVVREFFWERGRRNNFPSEGLGPSRTGTRLVVHVLHGN